MLIIMVVLCKLTDKCNYHFCSNDHCSFKNNYDSGEYVYFCCLICDLLL